MPTLDPDKLTDSTRADNAKPIRAEDVCYETPYAPRTYVELSDDFIEEHASGPRQAGEFPESWQTAKRTKSTGPGTK